MPARWSTDSVLALAPDASSQRTAVGLAASSSWTGTGAAGDVVWGACAGSGKNPYQVVVDVAGPAYKCSCPSRKFPCKHALALLLKWAQDGVPEQDEPAGYAREWKASRAARAAGAATRAPGKAKDAAAAARRSEQRSQRVTSGMAELEAWLGDQVRAGLEGAAGSGAHSRGPSHVEAVTARMVDAQAPGVANSLRRLATVPVSGQGWPGRLLAGYAQLHLLARAYGQLDALPPGLAAVVRSRVGFTTSREEVLAQPAVTDHWRVVGVHDLLDEHIPTRRVWLLGRDTGRFALLLSFAVQGYFSGDPDAMLVPGTELHADVHYYPGQPLLRAVTGKRHSGPADSPGPGPGSASSVTSLLESWAAALEQDPWLSEWPVLVLGTPVVAGGGWVLAAPAGEALPLLGRECGWPLLAVSGGHPVMVAGEWGRAGLTPLTVWHGDLAVRL
ncbi:MAG TPA: SWIM zinc finger family protein [Streptosporangiaceae bacterium]|nr:SWIM zinc finger family protein [Streptosporangiaceae bacterium]